MCMYVVSKSHRIHIDAMNALMLAWCKHIGTIIYKHHSFLHEHICWLNYKLYGSAFIEVDVKLSYFYFYETMFKIEHVITMLIGPNFADILCWMKTVFC